MINWEGFDSNLYQSVFNGEVYLDGKMEPVIIAVRYRGANKKADPEERTKVDVWSFVKSKLADKIIRSNQLETRHLSELQLIQLKKQVDIIWKKFVDKMYKEWRTVNYEDRSHISFSDYFLYYDHVVVDLAISSTFPIMVRFMRPDIVDREAKTVLGRNASFKLAETFFKEIDYFYNQLCEETEFNSSKCERALIFRDKVKDYASSNSPDRISKTHMDIINLRLNKIFQRLTELKDAAKDQNYKILIKQVNECLEMSNGPSNRWYEAKNIAFEIQKQMKEMLLSSQAYQELRDKLQKVFSTINENQKQANKEKETNYNNMKAKLDELSELSLSSTSWKEVRERLMLFQSEMKQKIFFKNNRDELQSKLQEAFSNLNERQTKANELYRKECDENYKRLITLANSLRNEADHSTDWSNIRDQLKSLQGDLRTYKLSRENRENVYSIIQAAFSRLNDRQNAAKDKYTSDCESNYNILSIQVARVSQNAHLLEDLSFVRNSLKEVQRLLFSTKPLNKNHFQELKSILDSTYETLNKRQSDFNQRRQQEYKSSLSEKINKLKSSIYNLQNVLNSKRDYEYNLKCKIDSVRPGMRA